MDARALLFGSKLRIVATVVFGLGLTVGGAFLAGVVGVPSVERIDNRFGDVNETDTAIETDLVVHNPNPVGVRLGNMDVNYTVTMNDVAMAQGTKRGVGIGTGNSTVNLTTYLQNERIPAWWTSHIRNGEHTDLAVSANVKSGTLGRSATFQPATESIDTDLVGEFNSSEDRPVNSNMALVDDPVVVIRQTNASWGTVTDSETPIRIEFGVYNPKATPVAISNVGYDITMNDVQMGSGETEETETIPGKTYRVVETRTVIDNEQLDDWWVSHVENDQTTELRIDFYAEIEPPGTDETFRAELDELTHTETIETDFFGTKGDTASDDTDDSNSTEDTTTTTTSDEQSTTTTTTSTSTTTTTEENTTTTEDDGILALDPLFATSSVVSPTTTQ
ncbi:LEA type 2 family protein [Halobacterium wangiae]|uniref:LEA type 2 family protein n=1 Tax=Halobacterium wangiae TaxID=2902623 RepID=UPI001E33D9EB|nr:LEA type 2 family protein [Halobacterium wangiae]